MRSIGDKVLRLVPGLGLDLRRGMAAGATERYEVGALAEVMSGGTANIIVRERYRVICLM